MTSTLQRKTPLKRTGIKRKPAKRKAPANRCISMRCTRRASVKVSEERRYCKTHARRIADAYQRIAIFTRDHGTCQSCSRKPALDSQLQRAHIISRGARFIEYEEDNLVTLCQPCHLNFTLKPAAWSVWLATYRPGLHDRLALLEAEGQRQGGSVDLAEIIRRYEVTA